MLGAGKLRGQRGRQQLSRSHVAIVCCSRKRHQSLHDIGDSPAENASYSEGEYGRTEHVPRTLHEGDKGKQT
jgi:hypothetical protein